MSSSWIGIWFTAIMRPSVSGYENLSLNPKATAKIGYLWVIITGVISAVISSVLLGNNQQAIISLLCGVPLFTVGGLLALGIITGSVHGIAKLLGGMGSYSQVVYIISAFSAPMTILSCVLYFIPFGKWLNGLLMIYWIFLTIFAVKAVYKFSWIKCVISSIVLIIISLLASIGIILLPSPA
jgi:hypothetical protein